MKQNNDEKGLSQIHFGDKIEGYKSSKKSLELFYIYATIFQGKKHVDISRERVLLSTLVHSRGVGVKIGSKLGQNWST